MRRISLGRNPLQESLIDGLHEPAAMLGETAKPTDRERLAGQLERVISLMADGYWHTLPELHTNLQRRFGRRYSETSISARLRQMRGKGWAVQSERTRPKSGLFQYRAVKIVNHHRLIPEVA